MQRLIKVDLLLCKLDNITSEFLYRFPKMLEMKDDELPIWIITLITQENERVVPILVAFFMSSKEIPTRYLKLGEIRDAITSFPLFEDCKLYLEGKILCESNFDMTSIYSNGPKLEELFNFCKKTPQECIKDLFIIAIEQ